MGVLAKVKSIFKPKTELTRAQCDASDPAWIKNLTQDSTLSRHGNPHALLEAHSKSPPLHMVQRAIMRDVSTTEWILAARVDLNTRKVIDSPRLKRLALENRTKAFEDMLQSGELVLIEEHPLYDFLERGNSLIDGSTCIGLTAGYLDCVGEAFWLIEPNNILGRELPYQFWPLPPTWVKETPQQSSSGMYKLSVSGKEASIAPECIVQFRDPALLDPYGRGPGTAATLADELDTDEYAAEFSKYFFLNDAVPPYIIMLSGATKDGVDRLREGWDNEHRGFGRRNRLHFMGIRSGSDVKVQELGQPFNDDAVINLRKYERDLTIQTHGYTPEALGIIEHSNKATAESSERRVARHVINPRTERIRSVLQRDIAPRFDERLVVHFKSHSPEDREEKLEWAKANPNTLTVGEWRELQGVGSRGEQDDVHLTERKYIPVEDYSEWDPPQGMGTGTGATGTDDSSKALAVVSKADAADTTAQRIIESLTPEKLAIELRPEWTVQLEAEVAGALGALGSTVAFNIQNPFVTNHLIDIFGTDGKGGKHLKWVTDTVKRQTADALAQALKEGKGGKDLAQIVKKEFNLNKTWMARRVSVTEVGRSANFATWHAQEISGVVTDRKWVASFLRTRDTHKALHGQVRKINVPFDSPDGDKAMYPGDFSKASNNINCGCTTVVVRGDDQRHEMPEFTKDFLDSVEPWVDAVDPIFVKAYEDWEVEILNNIELAVRRGKVQP